MKYLNSSFSLNMAENGDAYRDGWERTFGAKDEAAAPAQTGPELKKLSKREWVNEFSDRFVLGGDTSDTNPDDAGLLVMDGYDECIVGICRRFNAYFVVYDYNKVIQRLASLGTGPEKAEEWFNENIASEWHGDVTPAFLVTPESENA